MAAVRIGSSRPDRVGVEDARVLQGRTSLVAKLGDTLHDRLCGRLLRVGVGDSLILAGVYVAAEAEDEKLTVCSVGPSHSPVPGPRVLGVDVPSVGTVVDVWGAGFCVLGCSLLVTGRTPSGWSLIEYTYVP